MAQRKGEIHFAQLKHSERLQRVLKMLQDGKPHSTMEIMQEANVCAVNSIIAELRMNRLNIECKQVTKGVFQYTLLQDKAA